MAGSSPATISGLTPSRGISLGARRDDANRASVIGRKATPARSGLKPMTFCRNWVRKKNTPNIPAIRNSRAMNEPDLLMSANRRSGVIGCLARVSVTTNRAISTAAAPNATSPR
jgi:hypothetical protein